MTAIYVIALSMFVVIALVPLLARIAAPLGLIDQPGPRKIHQRAVPRVGGIAIAIGAIVSILLWVPMRVEIQAYAAAAALIFLFGLADDRFSLDFRLKLAGQIAGAAIFVFAGDMQFTRMPFAYDGEMPGWIGLPLTLIFIVGVTNAVNMTDGMDGLAGGNSLLAACTLGYLVYIGGDKQITLMALAVIGATLGFLRYNTYPARVFMGDAGSQFLGFSVAVLGLLLVERCNTAISPLVPLLLLALPIIDMLQVVVARLRAGRSPFAPDRRHVHHRLLDAGLSQYQVVVVIYGLQILLIALTWWLLYAPDLALAAGFLLFAAVLLSLVAWWHRRHRQGKSLIGSFGAVDGLVRFLQESGMLARSGRQGVLWGVSLLLPLLALGVTRIDQDIAWLALLLLAIMGLLLWPRFSATAVVRLPAFGTAVIAAYLAFGEGLRIDAGTGLLMACFAGIAVSMALWIRFGGPREFRLNTLDLLVILIVAVAPNLPAVGGAGLGPTVIGALFLFYACELILSERPADWRPFRIGVSTALIVFALRGLLP